MFHNVCSFSRSSSFNSIFKSLLLPVYSCVRTSTDYLPFSFLILHIISHSLQHHGLYSPWNSPSQITGVGSLSLFQVIFPTQGLKPGLPHYRWILYWLNHKGSPRILEWVTYSFSSGSSQPRNWTRVSCIAGRFFTNWSIRETLLYDK